MVLRKSFFTDSVALLFCTVFMVFAGLGLVKGDEKEKSELAELMCKIDAYSKALDRLATYFSFDEVEKERKIYEDTCANLVLLCKTATTKFERPDDNKYQEFNQAMLKASENIAAILKDANRANSLEDMLWETGKLRQTCVTCHKHLDIHIGSDKHGGKK
ncbi:MAG: hypothetical protein CV087_22195 [Candidatus Brocadia sp. WS118]|nr:MAG: hypothetical protein CV087_22195 [Candidatus Brocadia sp. WS118]